MNEEQYPAFSQSMGNLIQRGGKLREQVTVSPKLRFADDNTPPESRSYKAIPDEHDAYASTDEQGRTVFERRGVTLERERGWKEGVQHVRVRTNDPATVKEIHREFKSGIGESEYSSVTDLGQKGAHHYWRFGGSKQAGEQELGESANFTKLRASLPSE
jgi:hypothetical protein